MLFELSSMTTDTIILEQDIMTLINNYEPRAQVNDVLAQITGNSLNVSMYFTIANNPLPQELNITLQRVR